MKKRMTAIAMAGLMVFGMCAPVMAEEEVIEMSYEDIDPDVYEGEWIAFDYGFDLYLPVDWEEQEITDEMLESGIVYDLADAETGMNVAVSVATAEDLGADAEVEDIYNQLDAEGYASLYYMNINGIGAVGYDVPDTDVSGVAFTGENGDMYMVTVGPVADDDEEAGNVALNIFMSISQSEGETETEE